MAIDYKKVERLRNDLIATIARAQHMSLTEGSGSSVVLLRPQLRKALAIAEELEQETSMAKLMASD